MTVQVHPRQPRHQAAPKKPSETQKGVDQVLQSFNLAVQIKALELFLLPVLLLRLFSDIVRLVKAWCMENMYLERYHQASNTPLW